MATILYKKDPESGGVLKEMFDGSEVGNLIHNGGWHTRVEDVYQEQDSGKDHIDDDGNLVLDNLDLSKLENDDIREVARAAGIRGWKTKRIATLKKLIEGE